MPPRRPNRNHCGIRRHRRLVRDPLPPPGGVLLGCVPRVPAANAVFTPEELAVRLAVYATRAARGEPIARPAWQDLGRAG
jgi:hypothetical protein